MSSKVPPFRGYPVPEFKLLPQDIQNTMKTASEKTGFIPNVFLALAHRPDEFRAFVAYHDALMEKDSNLTKAEREMIVVATSAKNSCQYCVVAHGAILRLRSKSSVLSEQISVNYKKADISDRQKAMIGFALKVSIAAGDLEESDFEELEKHGFNAEDAWDIAAITGLFGMSNRMANFLSLRANDEFYTMGRDFTG